MVMNLQIITRGTTSINVIYPGKMSVLWKYLKPQKGLIVVALVLAGISKISEPCRSAYFWEDH